MCIRDSAGDQHIHARAGKPPDRTKHLLHRGRAAEQLGDLRQRDRAVDPADPGGGGALDQVDRLVNVEGLGQVFERTALVG